MWLRRKHERRYREIVSEESLREFESKWGVSLPSEYRQFLGEVGNGMVGDYLVSALNECFQPYSDEKIRGDQLSRIFNPDMSGSDLVPGTLRICNIGCDGYLLLVVSGDHRGEIWTDIRVDGVELYPLKHADGSAMRFAEWLRTVERLGEEHVLMNDPRQRQRVR